MFRRSQPYYLVLAVALLFVQTASLFSYSGRRHKEALQTTEREIKVTIEAGLGDLNIAKSKEGKAYEATVESERKLDWDNCIDYEVIDKVGFLTFSSDCDNTTKKHTKNSGIHIDGFESTDWWLDVTDAVPVSFDMELGMGKANLNMTGLSVKDFNLSTGASSVSLQFDEPNKSVIEDMSLEAGLSKFDAKGLGNANFNHLKFDGGMGTYSLDFSGKLDHEVDVDIDIGLGTITIIVPKKIGVKVYCEKNWISHLSIDDDFKERDDDTYYTSNYNSASGKINMHIEAGMGAVKIRRQ